MSNDPHRVLRRNSPPSKRLDVKEWGSEEDDPLPEPVPSDNELPGTVFAVPDRLWGFNAVGREDHPDICTEARPETINATLVKGRDAATDRGHPRTRFVVEPSLINGLRKMTSFELVPRTMSLRHVRLLVLDRRMGKLEPNLFAKLRQRLVNLFPPAAAAGPNYFPSKVSGS
jgi:hypothetical protein